MSRKDPYFSFKDRDSVEYKPQYGTAYTPRQEKILSGELKCTPSQGHFNSEG